MEDETTFLIIGVFLLIIGILMVVLLYNYSNPKTIDYSAVCKEINKPYLGIIEHEKYVEVFCYDNFKRDTHKVVVLKNGTV